MTSSGGGATQFMTLSLPLRAAALFGCSSAVFSTMGWLSASFWEILVGPLVSAIIGVETSNGINLAMGQLVLPYDVLI